MFTGSIGENVKKMPSLKEALAKIPRQERSTRVNNIEKAREELAVDRKVGVLWDLKDDSLISLCLCQ